MGRVKAQLTILVVFTVLLMGEVFGSSVPCGLAIIDSNSLSAESNLSSERRHWSDYRAFEVHAKNPTSETGFSTALIRVRDPHRQHNPVDGFSIAGADANFATRVAFIDQSLAAEDRRLKVIIGMRDLQIYHSWFEHERPAFTPDELEGPIRIFIDFACVTDENPQMVLFGAIAELSIDRLFASESFRNAFTQTVEQAVARMAERWGELSQSSNEEDQRRAYALGALLFDRGRLEWEIQQIYRLRIVWEMKIGFFRKNIARYPVLRSAPLSPPATTLDVLANLDPSRYGYGTSRYDSADRKYRRRLISEFADFYSKHSSFNLSPVLIEEIWDTPLPGLIESSSEMPILLFGLKF